MHTQTHHRGREFPLTKDALMRSAVRASLAARFDGRATNSEVLDEILRPMLSKLPALYVRVTLHLIEQDRTVTMLWGGQNFTSNVKQAESFIRMDKALQSARMVEGLHSKEFRVVGTECVTLDEIEKGPAIDA